jgi:gamma-glutamylcyclotransferase (GGCT)/AIG2-like uncharacterized protein YtfP
MLPLFAYGTLRDPEYQRELFARTYPMRPAYVTRFIVVSTPGGYFAATPREGASIAGALVELDEDAYVIADAWEDRTVYDRVRIEARTATGRIQPAYMYVRPGVRGVPVGHERPADRARVDVIADIRLFCATQRFKGQR